MYFSMDFGGTNFRISWSPTLSSLKHPHVYKLNNSQNYLHDSQQIIAFMKSQSATADGIAIGLPGDFDSHQMLLKNARNLPSWVNQPFFLLLQKQFHCQPKVIKDAQIAALGEASKYPFRYQNFLYLTWGTGIGGCQVNYSSEHQPKQIPLNWYRHLRRFENRCSGGSSILNFGVPLSNLSPKQWDILTKNFVAETSRLCHYLYLNHVVLGGGITAKQKGIVKQIRLQLKQQNIILKSSSLSDNSAIYGGYYLLAHPQSLQ